MSFRQLLDATLATGLSACTTLSGRTSSTVVCEEVYGGSACVAWAAGDKEKTWSWGVQGKCRFSPGLHESTKPYLVLRDTLCSCGMKPMHKKKSAGSRQCRFSPFPHPSGQGAGREDGYMMQWIVDACVRESHQPEAPQGHCCPGQEAIVALSTPAATRGKGTQPEARARRCKPIAGQTND